MVYNMVTSWVESALIRFCDMSTCTFWAKLVNRTSWSGLTRMCECGFSVGGLEIVNSVSTLGKQCITLIQNIYIL